MHKNQEYFFAMTAAALSADLQQLNVIARHEAICDDEFKRLIETKTLHLYSTYCFKNAMHKNQEYFFAMTGRRTFSKLAATQRHCEARSNL